MADQTITVRGTAARRVMPDVAVWTAVAQGRGVDARTAYDACASAMRDLLTSVEAAAPEGAEVAAGRIWVSEEWSDGGRRRTGFVANGSVGMRAGLDEIVGLGQTALDAGAVRLDGPEYLLSDPVRLADELAAEAVAAARGRAEMLAGAAGRRVGGVRMIADDHLEPWTGPPQPAAMAAGGPAMRGMAAEAAPVSPEPQRMTATVVVRFDLLDDGAARR